MTKGFKDADKKFHPTEKKTTRVVGNIDKSDVIESDGAELDSFAQERKSMFEKLQKQKETHIHREPIIGYIKNYDYGNRRQPVTISVSLERKDGEQIGIDGKKYKNPLELGISAGIWNSSRTDITSGGQNQDTLRDALKKHDLTPSRISYQEMRKLLDVWDRWHLNDMKAGTEKQEKVIEEHIDDEKYKDLDKFYERKMAILKDHDLVTDNGIKWGNAWYYEPLPEDVIEFVKMIQGKLEA